jgi:cyclopropane fatty-acyl-phospholipid synthase-like methyltransferase
MRNAGPITDVLGRVFSRLKDGSTALEIAAGSGYHAAIFAQEMPQLNWQPSDPSAKARDSAAAHVKDSNLDNLKMPLALDVRTKIWPVVSADAILCINMIHISPWEATLGLFNGAQRVLPAGAPLVTYGPYSVDGDFIAESNIAFSQSLKQRNASWGLRNVKDVAAAAFDNGFRQEKTVQMPSNNLILVFKRAS